ncbi:MAG TPA: deoxyribose-phosphate aldolase [Anaeromyxobacteraceae bacterium]|nr:deoxyribose-phosphate aldolase [Anaeromyxobacteraceae bacterium]
MPLDPRSPRDLAPLIDHTLLAPEATPEAVARLCDEARAHGFAAVCVRAGFAAEARRRLAGTAVRTAVVVDFPKGEGRTADRVAEAVAAARAGAEELDLVVALPLVKAGRWGEVLDDLRAVVGAVAVPVKVILETAALDRDQKVAAAAVARAAGAAWVKTSTGYGPGGATAEDVALLRRVVGDALGVKASGGIRTASQALAMVRAGASRVGASASVAIVEGAFEPPGVA